VKIQIGDFWLAEAGREGSDELKVNGQRAIDVQSFLRAANVGCFQRGNKVCRISFAVTRKHETLLEAQNYVLKQSSDIPTTGAVKIVSFNPGGEEAVWYLRDGFLESHDSNMIGVTTFHNYALVGAYLTSERP
jgi:hypothetical protein